MGSLEGLGNESLLAGLYEGRQYVDQRRTLRKEQEEQAVVDLATAKRLGSRIMFLVEVLTDMPEDRYGHKFWGDIRPNVDPYEPDKLVGELQHGSEPFWQRQDMRRDYQENRVLKIHITVPQPGVVGFNMVPYDVSEQSPILPSGEFGVSERERLSYNGLDISLAARTMLAWAGRVAPHRADEIAGRLRAD